MTKPQYGGLAPAAACAAALGRNVMRFEPPGQLGPLGNVPYDVLVGNTG